MKTIKYYRNALGLRRGSISRAVSPKEANLYVIEMADTGRYKVGTSIDVDTRVIELQVGNPFKLYKRKVFCMHPDGVNALKLEYLTHGLLSEHRLCGEWFHRSLDGIERKIREAFVELYCPPLYERWRRFVAQASERTPALAKTLTPSNPFTKEMIERLCQILGDERRYRDLALFCIQIDGCLQTADLVSLRVSAVYDHEAGSPRKTINFTQKKGRKFASCEIGDVTQEAIRRYLATRSPASPNDYLFLGYNGHLTALHHNVLIKDWIGLLRQSGMRHLDPRSYGVQSIRKAKAVIAYNETRDIFACQAILRHGHIGTTVHYLAPAIRSPLDSSA